MHAVLIFALSFLSSSVLCLPLALLRAHHDDHDAAPGRITPHRCQLPSALTLGMHAILGSTTGLGKQHRYRFPKPRLLHGGESEFVPVRGQRGFRKPIGRI